MYVTLSSKWSSYNTDKHPFNGLFSRTTWADGNRKVKPIWILMK